MKDLSLKLKTQIKNVDLINNNEKFILNIILWSFGTLAFLYVVFLGNMVSNIVERRSLEGGMRTLSNEVNNLELDYLALSNAIDLEFSHSIGFKETKPVFATRKALGFRTSSSFDSIKVFQNEI